MYFYEPQKPKQSCCKRYEKTIRQIFPLNRFFFILWHKDEVNSRWGNCCGFRVFTYQFGVLIFAFFFIGNCIKDYKDIKSGKYNSGNDAVDALVEAVEKINSVSQIIGFTIDIDWIKYVRDDTYYYYFNLKLWADIVCVISGFLGFWSIGLNSYIIGIISYFVCFASFIMNTLFIIYIIRQLGNFAFTLDYGLSGLYSIFFCFICEYIWFNFAWILFCNWVNIKKEKDKLKKKIEETKQEDNFYF